MTYNANVASLPEIVKNHTSLDDLFTTPPHALRPYDRPSECQIVHVVHTIAGLLDRHVSSPPHHVPLLHLSNIRVLNPTASGMPDAPLIVELLDDRSAIETTTRQDTHFWMLTSFATLCLQIALGKDWQCLSREAYISEARVRRCMIKSSALMSIVDEMWQYAQRHCAGNSEDGGDSHQSPSASLLLRASPSLRVFATKGYSSNIIMPQIESLPALMQLTACTSNKEWHINSLIAIEKLLCSEAEGVNVALMTSQWIERFLPPKVCSLRADATGHFHQSISTAAVYLTQLNIIAVVLYRLHQHGDVCITRRVQQRLQFHDVESYITITGADWQNITPLLKRRATQVIVRLALYMSIGNRTVCSRIMTPPFVRRMSRLIHETTVPWNEEVRSYSATLICMMLVLSDFRTWVQDANRTPRASPSTQPSDERNTYCATDPNMAPDSDLNLWWEVVEDERFVSDVMPCFDSDRAGDGTGRCVMQRLERIACVEASSFALAKANCNGRCDVSYSPRVSTGEARLTSILAWMVSIVWHANAQVRAASTISTAAAHAAALTYRCHGYHFIALERDQHERHDVQGDCHVVEGGARDECVTRVDQQQREEAYVTGECNVTRRLAHEMGDEVDSCNVTQKMTRDSVTRDDTQAMKDTIRQVVAYLHAISSCNLSIGRVVTRRDAFAEGSERRDTWKSTQTMCPASHHSLTHVPSHFQRHTLPQDERATPATRISETDGDVLQPNFSIVSSDPCVTLIQSNNAKGECVVDVRSGTYTNMAKSNNALSSSDTCVFSVRVMCPLPASRHVTIGLSWSVTNSTLLHAAPELHAHDEAVLHAPSDAFEWCLATGTVTLSRNGNRSHSFPYTSPCFDGSEVAIILRAGKIHLVNDGVETEPLPCFDTTAVAETSRLVLHEIEACEEDVAHLRVPLGMHVYLNLTVAPFVSSKMMVTMRASDSTRGSCASMTSEQNKSFDHRTYVVQNPHAHIKDAWRVKLEGIPVDGNIFSCLSAHQQSLVRLIHRAKLGSSFGDQHAS